MGIVDILKRMGGKSDERKQKYKELEEDYRLHKTLEQRQKSSNERELEKYLKERREENIKKQLDIIRKQKQKESWKTNMFNGGTNILKDNKSLLHDSNPILKQKNIFSNNYNKQKEMFFKW